MTLIYLLGPGRTGTTAISRWIGSSSDIFAAGEIQNLWTGEGLSQRCSCKAYASDCVFWGSVLNRWSVASGRELADLIDFQRAQQLRIRTRHYPSAFIRSRWPRLGKSDDCGRKQYVDNYVGLVRAAKLESGCKVVLDSSKRPTEALLLAKAVSLCPILVMRHPSGVVGSYRVPKTVVIDGEDQTIPAKGVLKSAALWVGHGFLGRAIVRQSRAGAVVTQEAFVNEPAEVASKVLKAAGLNSIVSSAADVESVSHHLIGGNTDRFSAQGPPRSSRSKSLPRLSSNLVSLVTLVERRHYNYGRNAV